MADIADSSGSSGEGRLKILLVKLKHIGDALLMTPAIVAIRERYPDAEIWVVVRRGTEGILAGCPAIDKIVTAAPVDSRERGRHGGFWSDAGAWLRLCRQKFDYAFELTDGDRGRSLAGTTGARRRCVNVSRYPLNAWWRRWFNCVSDREWTGGHRVEKDFHAVAEFLPLPEEIPPLCFERERATEPEMIRVLDDFVIIHPGTRWLKKRWPKDYWVRLGELLLERAGKIVVSCGPDADERAFASELVEAWGADRAVSADGALSWSDLAGGLYRARVFVGVDTAAMHLAAACQCPMVTIFAYSVVSQWRPWKAPSEIVHLGERTPPMGPNQRPAIELMNQLTPEMVMAAVERLMRPPEPPR